MKRGTLVSLVALTAMTVASIGYLVVGVLDVNPTRTIDRVVVHM